LYVLVRLNNDMVIAVPLSAVCIASRTGTYSSLAVRVCSSDDRNDKQLRDYADLMVSILPERCQAL